MTIKAIPATYKGIEYRSRTEARWAVFFNMIGVDFDYEREGYATRLGWYVPDFWLPCCKCWIEIKGTDCEHNKHIEKLRIVCDATQSHGFVFIGPPKEMRGSFVGNDLCDSNGGCYPEEFNAGIVSADSKSIIFAIDEGRNDRKFYDMVWGEIFNVIRGNSRELQSRQIKDAADTASKHRFW